MTEALSKTQELQSPPSTHRLLGRRIVVTGAASGIGRSTAQLFASEGASVALFDRDERGVQATAEQTNGHGFTVDISNEKAVADAVERAGAALGGIDGVVNAAGIMFRGLAADVPAADWRQVLEVNLTGAYIVLRSCIPWMLREQTATVVNIASAQGLLPNAPGYTAYAASKGGVINLTRALAAELAPKVRVNSVCPGMVDTAMADGHRHNVGSYALNRLADPVEIARAILFLTSAESSYVTGAALATDGGRVFH
ncbi:SDR family NAD(P)-dependent oxidoreductase [Rhodococcus sp. T2V]|uniref:SDR family NAD(P)-dependent oxidoreductase n=1 Tax=Rhodococcus sp. T2V TaxID=3034164 RepID=UPI0023E1B6EF|nr:SDR family NAD(P)-dependent oxidoreductase [Rhodococcus sp. T2V]MDF3311225.1 SDR family NAD(P)-dependent oxidoreductase [Rhodococcus sp. T2V]